MRDPSFQVLRRTMSPGRNEEVKFWGLGAGKILLLYSVRALFFFLNLSQFYDVSSYFLNLSIN